MGDREYILLAHLMRALFEECKEQGENSCSMTLTLDTGVEITAEVTFQEAVIECLE